MDGIIRTAAEAHDIELSSLSGFAGPLRRKQPATTAWGNRSHASPSHNMFLSRVGALGMWPHVARESPQGGCTYFARSLARE